MADSTIRRLNRAELDGNYGTGENTGHPLQGTHPADRIVGPTHRLGPSQGGDCPAHDIRQQVFRLPALLLDLGEVEFAFVGFALFNLRPFGQRSLKTGDGFFRRTGAGPPAFLGNIRCAFGDAVDHQRQTARRDEGVGIVERQPGLFQPVTDQAFEIIRGARLHAGRDFLA